VNQLPTIDDVLVQIYAAFANVPRPENDELLHPNCADDNDIMALYEVTDWHDLSDATVENEYAALSFLSPAGFRYFIPAYMSFTLRHPESGAAAVESTIWSLSPNSDQHFNPSKFIRFDAAQSAAVVSFLEAMAAYQEVDDALLYWLERVIQMSGM
jgi:hypothetical protein